MSDPRQAVEAVSWGQIGVLAGLIGGIVAFAINHAMWRGEISRSVQQLEKEVETMRQRKHDEENDRLKQQLRTRMGD